MMKELFAEILNISISAGILIVVCVLVRLIFKKMPKFVRCLMWLLVAVRLVIPFNIESPFSLQPAREYVTISSGKEGSVAANEFEETVALADRAADKETVTATGEIENQVNNFDFMYVLSIIWVIGTAAVLIYAVIAYIRLRRSVDDAVLLRENIYQSERVGTAFILGILSPKIYIPYGLTEMELFMTLNHERAHLTRRDHLVKPLGFIITAVYWFNPLVWLAYILLCKDIELACDEKVIKKIGYDKKKDYSQTLLNLSIPRKYISACPVAFGECGINERIKNVLKMKKSKKIVIAAAVALCAILAVCFLTYPKDRKAASHERTEAQASESTANIEEIAKEESAKEESIKAEETTKADESLKAEEGTSDRDTTDETSKVIETEKDSVVQLELEGEEKVININYNVDSSPEVVEQPGKYVYENETGEDLSINVKEIEDVDSNTETCFPVMGNGIITRGFSDDHQGTDIAAEEGTDVASLYSGTVEDVGFNSQEGNYIIIKNSDCWTVKYSHLKDAPIVSKGDNVESGAIVGSVGSTGNSTGPHVHIEVIDDKGQYVDPMTVK